MTPAGHPPVPRCRLEPYHGAPGVLLLPHRLRWSARGAFCLRYSSCGGKEPGTALCRVWILGEEAQRVEVDITRSGGPFCSSR